ncbi:hypothetical protein [Nitrosovibrio sp. Nv4]|uniref:hypothetical protein n=1 Tax=Nitrosovibrio sp. Nv4 TaxID=1945880 RepID=UPI000BD00C84|nr:hypothetical protein [Nitrosovibrio sp. Nv4]SOD42007.1 hypothetical protein SAMN06298226_2334 [Nitrosovibrio sp. Nv4]
MTQQLFRSVLYFGYAILITLAFSPATHAQQTEALQLHRPDNHATQKESISGGACIVQTGAFPVGFNAYVVPDGDHPSYPPFCSPVPAGALNLVIDILASEFREMPLAVRLMKIENGEEREVLSVPAVEYTSGNIPLVVNLEPLGRYRVLLVGDDASGNTGNLVTIPLDVRKAGDYVHTGNGGTGWGFLLLVVGLAGLAGGLIHFWRPKSATTGAGASS